LTTFLWGVVIPGASAMATGSSATSESSTSSTAARVGYGDYIEEQLQKTSSTLKFVDVGVALLTIVVGVVVYLFAMSLVDHWLVRGGLGFWGRLLAFLVLVGGIVYFAVRSLIPHVLHRINPAFSAMTIEQAEPSLKNSVLNFLLLKHRHDGVPNIVIRGLEHFRVRKNAPEVASILTSQSDIDANSVESSYTLLKVFIWAIPILGFIGTVVGISAAVGGFSGTLDSADDISVLKDSLNNVTGGLATAFDTTLVALVMSMLVMFPTSSLQKAEEDLLNWVDEYCNENLLKRLDDGREGGAERGSSLQQAAIQQSVDRAMVGHHAEIKAWSKKLETIGSTLTDQVAAGWTSMQQDLQGQQQENLQRLQQIDSLADQFQANLTGLSENAEANGQQMAASLRDSAAAMSSYVSELQRGLQGLSEVLADLGQQQVIVQQQPRRGWFFRRRNGGK